MKHNLKITIILLGMFIVAQLIGLAVINAYTPQTEQVIINGTLQNISISPELPYGMQPPPEVQQMRPESLLFSIIAAIIIATVIIFLLSRVKAALFIRLWFFAVVLIAIGIVIFPIISKHLVGASYIALLIALPLAFYKVFMRNILIHNFTELLVYPGIAAVFVPILNIWIALALLVIIAVYDIYAVWKAKFMQKLAKYQIHHLKIFAGFFVPYLHKKEKARIKKLKKQELKKGRKSKKEIKVKVNLAILGGGDVAFPLIFAGVLLRASGWIPALSVVLFSTLALLFLFIVAKRGKFYPAMPFLSSGAIFGWLVSFLL